MFYVHAGESQYFHKFASKCLIYDFGGPMRTLQLIMGATALSAAVSAGCKTRMTEFSGKSGKDSATAQNDASASNSASSEAASENQRTIANFPKNGEIAAAQIRKTSGNSLSGRTITGTANAIPRTSSFLSAMGGQFSQLYDIHSDNFAVGTIGVNGQFSYIMYLNPTLGYINPATLTLMYCEPQLVSQSSEVVAILDCMDALPLSKISKTAKYGNGNPVFDIAGNVLYEDGAKATDSLTWWKSINSKTMFQGTSATYGNGQIMRDGTGTAWFSDGKLAYSPSEKALKFPNGTSNFAVGGTSAFYMDGAILFQSTPTGGSYNYQAGDTKKVLNYALNANGSRATEIFYTSGTKALDGTKVFRADGSEAPVEVYASEETLQNAVIWSASQLYTNLSISQFTKEATFNILDEYTGSNSVKPGAPVNPINLTLSSNSHNTMMTTWASGGGTTAGFSYKMIAGNTAPADCVGGVDSASNMSVTFNNLTPSTTYSIRVCARNEAGVLSTGVTASATTKAAPPAPPPTNILAVNGILNSGQFLSVNGKNASCNFQLLMQADGNLVVYRLPSTAIWSTRTAGRGASYFTLQPDRNAVVYKTNKVATWSSRSSVAGGDGSAQLELWTNGTLALRNGRGTVVWNSNAYVAACNQ
jgi:hypothetical protein